MLVGLIKHVRLLMRGRTVNVGGSAGVMTREDGLELQDAVLVGFLQTTKEGGVQVGGVVGVAVAAGRDTRVDTLCWLADFIMV